MENQKKHSSVLINLILIAVVIALAVVPLIFVKTGDFAGSDEKAKKAITEEKSNYKPWFAPFWKPPSSEIENFLFASQAALGAGFIGYYIGFVRGKSKGKSGK